MGRVVHPHIITTDSALGGLEIQRSLRFDDVNTSYFQRTYGSAGNQRTFTVSFWIKRTKLGRNNDIFTPYRGGDGSNESRIQIQSTDQLRIYDSGGSSGYPIIRTKALLRDVGSWYHLMVAVDTTQATDSNRIKFYINGELAESDPSGRQYVNQNQQMGWNKNHYHRIGAYGQASSPASDTANSDYLAEFHVIDGLQLDPSYFGFTEPQTGIWRPKKYTYGNYGTNGFYLDFSDNTSTTTLGYDKSGNQHNWTPNNFSVAAGEGNDSSLDTPTNNFCTLNPLERFTHNCTLSNGNLKATGPNQSYPGSAANIALSSGKWYYEFQINTKTSVPMCGVCKNDYVSGGAGRILYRAGGHYVLNDGSEPTDPDSFDVGDIIGVAIDLDDTAGNIRFYKNGTLQTVNSNLNSLKSQLSISTLGGLHPYIQMYHNDVCTVNFGQRPFSYTPPTGFSKLSSNNLPATSSVLNPKKHFDTLTWTGTDHNYRDITGLDFAPDFVWVKNRSQTDWHIMSNSIDGFHLHHYSNDQGASNSNLNTNGYINGSINGHSTISGQGGISVNGQGGGNTNELNENYVAWCWKGGSPVTPPTSGSILIADDNNYLDLGSYTDFQFGTGDYTIEMFVYHTTLSGQQTYASDVNGNSAGVYFYKTNTHKLAMYYSGTIAESSSTTIPLMKWVHVLVSRSSGTTKLFQDGIEVASGSDTTNLTATQMNIGDSSGGTSGSMHGYISNVRILKGTGLYTSNFTVPTSPLTNITNTKFLGCQSSNVAGLASVHPSPFALNGTNYSSGSQLDGALTSIEGTYSHGGPAGLFDGRLSYYGSDTYASSTLSSDNYIEWTPTSAISYTSKLEVWCYAANGYNITNYYYLNGGSGQTFTGGSSNFNSHNWITIDTGSGTLTSLKIRLTRSGSASFVNWGAIRVDGCILTNDVTGKVVTPTVDMSRSVPATPKNPFDGEFAVDGTRYQTAAAAGITDGTLALTAASINKKAGFSIVGWNGTGSAGTIGHGLGKKPTWWLMKNITASSDWYVYYTAVDGSLDYLVLNGTNNGNNSGAAVPTTTTIGATTTLSTSGDRWIAYIWTDIPGYSKTGSYTTNGTSGDGPFIYLGFKPAFFMHKRTDDNSSNSNWRIWDSGRVTDNPVDIMLQTDNSSADYESANVAMDFVSNGVKVRATDTSNNNPNGATFVYFALAEKPNHTPYQTESNAR